MTATVTAGRIIPGVYATVDQRRACLLDLAETISVEQRRNAALWGDDGILQLVVPPLAAAACPDPLARFSDLVDAVAQFTAFCSDEMEWLTAHDLGTSAEVASNIHDKLRDDVEFTADRLMGRQS